MSTMFRGPRRYEEDVVILQRIKAGEEAALSELYDRYDRLLYSFSMHLLKSPEEAEEVVQGVFMNAWNNADAYQSDRGTVYTWLVSMTRANAIDRLRSKDDQDDERPIDHRGWIVIPDVPASDSKSNSVVSEYRKIVGSMIPNLHVDQLQVIALAYYEGYTQSEIAALLDLPIVTVKERFRNGLPKLRLMLRKKL